MASGSFSSSACRATVRVKAYRLGEALDWAVGQARVKGFAAVAVACEPTGPRWMQVQRLCGERGLPLVCIQPLVSHIAREQQDYTTHKADLSRAPPPCCAGSTAWSSTRPAGIPASPPVPPAGTMPRKPRWRLPDQRFSPPPCTGALDLLPPMRGERAMVSGNGVGRSCFRILSMSCEVWSADVHRRMPSSRAGCYSVGYSRRGRAGRRITVKTSWVPRDHGRRPQIHHCLVVSAAEVR